MAGGPVWARCGVGVNTDGKFLIDRVARIVMKSANGVSDPEGLGVRQTDPMLRKDQREMSADELEQWTLWQRPEMGYYQTLIKKKITSSLLFSDGM